MTTWVPASLVLKEFRSLYPTWAACILAIVAWRALATATWQPARLLVWVSQPISLNTVGELLAEGLRLASSAPFGLAVLGFGSIALGTQLFGQEFDRRTLPLLLAQPVARQSVLLVKMGVLAALVLSLGLVSTLLLPAAVTGLDDWSRLGLLFTVCGVFVAPCLTLLTRSGLAGLIFSIAVPATMALAAHGFAISAFGGSSPQQIEAVRNAALLAGTCLASLTGAVGTAWAFMRMEVLDAGAAVPLTASPARTITTSATRRYHPIAQLIGKELRLQQMAFVLAAMFVLASGGLLLFGYLISRAQPAILESVATLYLMLLGVVAGSIPSAEERSLGTLQQQLLLPISTRAQWIVKASVASVLVITLGAGLPTLVLYETSSATWWGRVWPFATLMLVLVASLSLYVSTLCSSGVRALLAAIPTVIGAMLTFSWVEWTIHTTIDWWARSRGLLNFSMGILWGSGWTQVLFAGVMTAVLLYFGSANSRTLQPARVVPRQLGWIGSIVVLLLILVEVATARWILRPPGW